MSGAIQQASKLVNSIGVLPIRTTMSEQAATLDRLIRAHVEAQEAADLAAETQYDAGSALDKTYKEFINTEARLLPLLEQEAFKLLNRIKGFQDRTPMQPSPAKEVGEIINQTQRLIFAMLGFSDIVIEEMMT